MSTPVADGGAIQNFVRSLYSGRFYGSAPRLGLGVGFRNLMLMSVILGFVSSIQWTGAVSRGLHEWQERVEDGSMPVLTLKGGRLSVLGAQPYLRKDAAGGVLIVDTTGVYQALPDSIPAGVLLTRDRLVHKTAPLITRTYKYSDYPLDVTLDGPGIRRYRGSLVPIFLASCTIIGFLTYFLLNALLCVPLAGLGLLLMRAFTPALALSYRQILTVMLFVVTPVAILFKFLSLVSPEQSSTLLPFYPALAASLLVAALRASMNPPEPPETT